jgi:hypothetical protein
MTKYQGNDLIDFLKSDPMEMREFMDAYDQLNFFHKWIIKILSYFW